MKIERKVSKVLQYKDILPGEVFRCASDLTEPTIYMGTTKKDTEGDRICVDLETGDYERFQPYVEVIKLPATLIVEDWRGDSDEGNHQTGD